MGVRKLCVRGGFSSYIKLNISSPQFEIPTFSHISLIPISTFLPTFPPQFLPTFPPISFTSISLFLPKILFHRSLLHLDGRTISRLHGYLPINSLPARRTQLFLTLCLTFVNSSEWLTRARCPALTWPPGWARWWRPSWPARWVAPARLFSSRYFSPPFAKVNIIVTITFSSLWMWWRPGCRAQRPAARCLAKQVPWWLRKAWGASGGVFCLPCTGEPHGQQGCARHN